MSSCGQQRRKAAGIVDRRHQSGSNVHLKRLTVPLTEASGPDVGHVWIKLPELAVSIPAVRMQCLLKKRRLEPQLEPWSCPAVSGADDQLHGRITYLWMSP